MRAERLFHWRESYRSQIVRTAIIIAIVFFAAAPAFALDPAKRIAQYKQHAWQAKDGLPGDLVTAIVQTRDGYLWLGTSEGLVRFDGVRFTVFDRGNTEALKSNRVNSLLEDRSGNLWIGTTGGLTKYHDNAFTTFTTDHGLSSNIVGALCEDRAGRLWIGTADKGGLNVLENNVLTVYTVADGLAGNVVRSVFEDSKGTLWAGTNNGLSRFQDGRFVSEPTFENWTGKPVNLIYEDRRGGLWFCAGGILHQYQNDQLTTYGAANGFLKTGVFSVSEDRHGSLWFGTPGALMRFRNNEFERLGAETNFPDTPVTALEEDSEGNLWVGTVAEGLRRLSNDKFTVYHTAEGLPDKPLFAVFETRGGAIWIGSYGGGLSRFENGRFRTFTTRDGLPSDIVYSVNEDQTGDLWIGTSAGLVRYDGKRFQTFTTEDGLPVNSVFAVYPDRAGNLWVGTNGGGASLYRDGKFTNYSAKNGLPHKIVWHIYEDRAGALWFGGLNSGLSRLRNGEFATFTVEDGLSHDDVHAVYEDADGALWIATDNGLTRFKDDKLAAVTTKNGLFHNTVYNIFESAAGDFWMSSDKGVSRVARAELNRIADGALDRVAPISYTVADGLLSNNCSGGVQNAGQQMRDGKLWFTTIKGVAVIDPADITINRAPPPVKIEKITADGSPMTIAEKTNIAAGTERFEFYYTGLSFVAPERVLFRYKLEGFDRDWIEADTRRVAYYTHLPPGDYRFRVAAANNDGIWNETGTSLDFRLQPRFYQTAWFYALCIALLGLFGFLLYQRRMRQLNREFALVLAERTRVAREMHDTLVQGALGAAALLSAAARAQTAAPTQTADYLEQAREQLQHTIDDARSAIWNLRHQTVKGEDLAQRIEQELRLLTASTNVTVGFKVEGQARELSGNIAGNLIRIHHEAVINAVKHAGTCQLDVSLEFARKYVKLNIHDDGCGFDAALKQNQPLQSLSRNGFGLLGIRERAEEINAQLTVNSIKGDGTNIILRVPLP